MKSAEAVAMDALRPYLLDPREDYPEPYYMLELNGVPFSTLGGLQAISGQKKNGKSFVLTMLMAAILGDDGERVQRYLPGLRVPDRTIEKLGHPPRVLYVDTEMERLNSAKVLRRVHWLCGWDMKYPNDRFNVLWLKTIQKEGDDDRKDYQKRYQLIKTAIDLLTPDVVVVDGLRDLLSSINDEESITQMLGYLGSLAEERNMSIWSALHQNPNQNSDDAKMRGWAGTELGNKVSDTLVSIKKKDATGVTFTVKQQDARGKDIDDWKFVVTADAGSLGIPKIIGSGVDLPIRQKVKADTVEDIRAWVKAGADMYEWPMSRKDIKTRIFGEIGKQKNRDMQASDLQVAVNNGFLVESLMKANGYNMLEPSGDIIDIPF